MRNSEIGSKVGWSMNRNSGASAGHILGGKPWPWPRPGNIPHNTIKRRGRGKIRSKSSCKCSDLGGVPGISTYATLAPVGLPLPGVASTVALVVVVVRGGVEAIPKEGVDLDLENALS